MKCSQFNFYIEDNYRADGKARLDISSILINNGISNIYSQSPQRVVRLLRQAGALLRLGKTDLLFVQYPAGRKEFIKLARMLYHRHIKIAAYIHDLDSIRTHTSLQKEIDMLSLFDCLISHNSSMTQYIRSIGYDKPIIELEIFDYLHNIQRPVAPSELNAGICFAGNLDKSKFISQLKTIKNTHFELYGVCKNSSSFVQPHITYNGSLPADEIPFCLKGAFGLVWDGESIESCTGELGEYLKYNNPHKLSLYMAAGKPVIVWSHSAIADFVKANGLGLVVDNLYEAADKIAHMTEKDYIPYQEHAMIMKARMADGYYTSQAARKIIALVRGSSL